jgi:chemotaxis regulatin CheY-phosphate phosphatase CheZ
VWLTTLTHCPKFRYQLFESAKDMLAEVVEMTETATMNIMDISEDMQEQCSIIKKTLDDVRTLNFVGNAHSSTEDGGKKDPLMLMRDMLDGMRALRESLSALPVGHIDSTEAVTGALAAIDLQIGILNDEYNRQLNSSDRYMVIDDGFSMVRKEDHDRLITALEASDHVIQCIITNISRILESLSFQDLSGQRIIKIVDLLSNVQIQLLSILVSSGVKLKRLREGKSIEKKSAEAEVDELMRRFRPDEAKDGHPKTVLDQQAIDSLLADLGF